MKELHTLAWYASRVSPHLPKEAFKPVPSRLFGGLAYLSITVTGFLVIGIYDLSVWLNLLISIILGASFAAMGFLGHEILHGTVVRKAWLRDFLGAVAFFPLSTGPKLWRKWHNLNHHVHTQHEEHDPDSWLTIEQVANLPLLNWYYKLPLFIRSFVNFCSLTITFTFQSMKMFILYIQEFNPKKQRTVWFQFILPWAAWFGLLIWIGPLKWFYVFLLPLLIANGIVMIYISTNHRLNPLVPINDPLANSLTVTVPKWINALHFNFSYHTEHHLFPGISSKYYPLVKEQIQKQWPEKYHEMPLGKALKALWMTPRIYYQHNDLYDPRHGKLYGSLGNGLKSASNHYNRKN